MKLIVFGASGQTGKILIELAAGAKHEVTAFARSPDKLGTLPAGVKVAQGDASDPKAVEDAMAGQEGALVVVGPPNLKRTTVRQDIVRNVIAGMKKHGGKRLAFLSASGVGDSLPQVKKASFIGGLFVQFVLAKTYQDSLAAEELIKQSGLEWVIVRPVQLTNRPPKRDVTAITDGSTEGLKTTIPRADVARFMLISMTDDRYLGKTPTLSS